MWSCAHVLTNFKEENIGDPIYVAHHREYDIDHLEYKYVYSSKKWKVGGHLKIKSGPYVTTVYQDANAKLTESPTTIMDNSQ